MLKDPMPTRGNIVFHVIDSRSRDKRRWGRLKLEGILT